MFDIFRKEVMLFRRYGSYSDDDGKWKMIAPVPKKIKASTRNFQYNELLMLSEAQRYKKVLVLLTDEELQIGSPFSGLQADIIVIGVQQFQVIKTKIAKNINWCTAHYEAVIVSCDNALS